MDYVFKWVVAIPYKTNDSKVVVKFLKENIFSRFGTPRAIISDNGSQFCNRTFRALMQKYAITHKLFTPYHPQTSGHIEVSNRQLILENTMNQNRKDWFSKLVDAFWVYRTAFKMILGMSSYRLVFGKTFHLPVEFKHRALWAIKQLNFNLDKAGMFENYKFSNLRSWGTRLTKMWRLRRIGLRFFMISLSWEKLCYRTNSLTL